MTNVEHLSGDPDEPAAAAPGMTSDEAIATLLAAVDRVGPPWSFVPGGDIAGRDLNAGGRRAWPLCRSDGELLGMVVRDAAEPDERDELVFVLLRTVRSLVDAEQRAAHALERAQAAEREARIDALTGVLTRRAWADALTAEEARMRRNGKASVIVVVDIDDLKEANDRDGHLAGDILIRRTAEGLRRAVRDADVVARIGGDEFAILAVESEPSVPDSLVKRIERSLCDLQIEASVGAAVATPGGSLARAFDEADRRMYEEKQRRRRARNAERFLGGTSAPPGRVGEI